MWEIRKKEIWEREEVVCWGEMMGECGMRWKRTASLIEVVSCLMGVVSGPYLVERDGQFERCRDLVRF
jgi:hypothetical protein